MTLTEIAGLTKKGMVFFVIFVIIALSGWIGFKYYQGYKKAHTPPVQILPDAKWGVLPKPIFPQGVPVSTKETYTLSTSTGALPEKIPKILKVYFIPQLGTTLLAGDKAKELATSFGFENGPDVLSSIQYKFTDPKGGDFIMTLDSGNFSFRRPLATDSADVEDAIIADQGKLVEDFKSFLSNKGLLSDQLQNGKSKVVYDKSNQKDSSRAFISLWQQDVDNFPIVSSNPDKGLINGITTRFQSEKNRYLGVDYIFWAIDSSTFHTYPIKTAEEAFDQFKTGRGVVVKDSNNQNDGTEKNQISINSVYLAYYLFEDYTPYLQPIYVFEGEDYVVYLPAITDEFLEK